MKRTTILILVCMIILVSGCTYNQSPPDYIKDIAAYKEGSDGIFIYFVLADNNGQMTTANGKVRLIIQETPDFSFDTTPKSKVLLDRTVNILHSDFQKGKAGMGAFEHDILAYSIGRIAYKQLDQKPSSMMGKVKIYFTTSSGQVLEGEETVFF